jgi:hypothetical protein
MLRGDVCLNMMEGVTMWFTLLFGFGVALMALLIWTSRMHGIYDD